MLTIQQIQTKIQQNELSSTEFSNHVLINQSNTDLKTESLIQLIPDFIMQQHQQEIETTLSQIIYIQQTPELQIDLIFQSTQHQYKIFSHLFYCTKLSLQNAKNNISEILKQINQLINQLPDFQINKITNADKQKQLKSLRIALAINLLHYLSENKNIDQQYVDYIQQQITQYNVEDILLLRILYFVINKKNTNLLQSINSDSASEQPTFTHNQEFIVLQFIDYIIQNYVQILNPSNILNLSSYFQYYNKTYLKILQKQEIAQILFDVSDDLSKSDILQLINTIQQLFDVNKLELFNYISVTFILKLFEVSNNQQILNIITIYITSNIEPISRQYKYSSDGFIQKILQLSDIQFMLINNNLNKYTVNVLTQFKDYAFKLELLQNENGLVQNSVYDFDKYNSNKCDVKSSSPQTNKCNQFIYKFSGKIDISEQQQDNTVKQQDSFKNFKEFFKIDKERQYCSIHIIIKAFLQNQEEGEFLKIHYNENNLFKIGITSNELILQDDQQKNVLHNDITKFQSTTQNIIVSLVDNTLFVYMNSNQLIKLQVKVKYINFVEFNNLITNQIIVTEKIIPMYSLFYLSWQNIIQKFHHNNTHFQISEKITPIFSIDVANVLIQQQFQQSDGVCLFFMDNEQKNSIQDIIKLNEQISIQEDYQQKLNFGKQNYFYSQIQQQLSKINVKVLELSTKTNLSEDVLTRYNFKISQQNIIYQMFDYYAQLAIKYQDISVLQFSQQNNNTVVYGKQLKLSNQQLQKFDDQIEQCQIVDKNLNTPEDQSIAQRLKTHLKNFLNSNLKDNIDYQYDNQNFIFHCLKNIANFDEISIQNFAFYILTCSVNLGVNIRFIHFVFLMFSNLFSNKQDDDKQQLQFNMISLVKNILILIKHKMISLVKQKDSSNTRCYFEVDDSDLNVKEEKLPFQLIGNIKIAKQFVDIQIQEQCHILQLLMDQFTNIQYKYLQLSYIQIYYLLSNLTTCYFTQLQQLFASNINLLSNHSIQIQQILVSNHNSELNINDIFSSLSIIHSFILFSQNNTQDIDVQLFVHHMDCLVQNQNFLQHNKQLRQVYQFTQLFNEQNNNNPNLQNFTFVMMIFQVINNLLNTILQNDSNQTLMNNIIQKCLILLFYMIEKFSIKSIQLMQIFEETTFNIEILQLFILHILCIKLGDNNRKVFSNIVFDETHFQFINLNLNKAKQDLIVNIVVDLIKMFQPKDRNILGYIMQFKLDKKKKRELFEIYLYLLLQEVNKFNDQSSGVELEIDLDSENMISSLKAEIRQPNVNLFQQQYKKLSQNKQQNIQQIQFASTILYLCYTLQNNILIKASIEMFYDEFAQICFYNQSQNDQITSIQFQSAFLELLQLDDRDISLIKQIFDLDFQKSLQQVKQINTVRLNKLIYQNLNQFTIEKQFINEKIQYIDPRLLFQNYNDDLQLVKYQQEIQNNYVQFDNKIFQLIDKQLLIEKQIIQIQQIQNNLQQVHNLSTQKLLNDDNIQIYYSRLQLRQSQLHQYHFSQILLQKSIYTKDKEDNTLFHQLYCSSFINQSQFIMALHVKKQLNSNLSNEKGVLIITFEQIIYVPHVKFIQKQELLNQYLQHVNKITRINSQQKNIPENWKKYQYFGQFLSFLFDAQLETLENTNAHEIVSKTLYLNIKDIKGINAKLKQHRHSAFEIITSQGYSFEFDVMDKFTDKSHSDEMLTAEFSTGLLFHIIQNLFNINIICQFTFTPKILQFKFSQPIFSIGDKVLVSPNYYKNNSQLKKLLNQNLINKHQYYTFIFKKYMIKKFQQYEMIEINNNSYNSFVFDAQNRYSIEYQLEQFDCNIFNINNKIYNGFNKDVAIKNYYFLIIVDLYVNKLISTQQTLLYINLLSDRSPNDLQVTSIFPIIKGRNMIRPTQSQIGERLAAIAERYHHYQNEISKYPSNSALQLFNVQLFLNGTFTSNSASSLYFLFRQQPYASALIDLQSNKFDAPDRMFHSYNCLYKLIFANNYKEHIQQFYYSMKLFTNCFDFNIGKRHDNEDIDDLNFNVNQAEIELTIAEKDKTESPIQLQQELVVQEQEIDKEENQTENLLQSQQIQTEELYVDQKDEKVEDVQQNDTITDVEQIYDDVQPKNLLALMHEFNYYIENVNKKRILNWLQLFFGIRRNDMQSGQSYPNSIYHLVLLDEKIVNGELDKTTYFGVLCDQLLFKDQLKTLLGNNQQNDINNIQPIIPKEMIKRYKQLCATYDKCKLQEKSNQILVQFTDFKINYLNTNNQTNKLVGQNKNIESNSSYILIFDQYLRYNLFNTLLNHVLKDYKLQLQYEIIDQYLPIYLLKNDQIKQLNADYCCRVVQNIILIYYVVNKQDAVEFQLINKLQFDQFILQFFIINASKQILVVTRNTFYLMQADIQNSGVGFQLINQQNLINHNIIATGYSNNSSILYLLTSNKQSQNLKFIIFDILNNSVLNLINITQYVEEQIESSQFYVNNFTQLEINQDDFVLIRVNQRLLIFTSEQILIYNNIIPQLGSNSDKIYFVNNFYNKNFIIVQSQNKLIFLGIQQKQLYQLPHQSVQTNNNTIDQNIDKYDIYTNKYEQQNTEPLKNNIIITRQISEYLSTDLVLTTNVIIEFENQIDRVLINKEQIKGSNMGLINILFDDQSIKTIIQEYDISQQE